jgi:hypothetical protein
MKTHRQIDFSTISMRVDPLANTKAGDDFIDGLVAADRAALPKVRATLIRKAAAKAKEAAKREHVSSMHRSMREKMGR